MTYSLPFTAESRVIELGGGACPMNRPAWPNCDVRPGPTVDIVASFEEPLPIESGQFDGVVSKFAAEHVSWQRVGGFFAETHRILKPGGVLVLVVPNHLEQCRLAVELGDRGEWEHDNGVPCRNFGTRDYRENGHAAGWSPEFLCRQLRGWDWHQPDGPNGPYALREAWCGFSSVLILPFGATDMICEAVKGA